MTAGYCRHDWTTCNDALRAAFPSHSGIERDFRVCSRCLRIEEQAPSAGEVTVLEPKPGEGSLPPAEGDERVA